ncbi:ATP-binding protein [Streptomyces capparidis]
MADPVPLRVTARWEADASMIPAARDFAASFLDRLRVLGTAVGDAARSAVLLVVSELVTNVVRHAPGPCRLTLRAEPGLLGVAVTDTSPARPRARPQDPSRVGQHGMELVHALCLRVETEQTGPGKTVRAWIRLA